MIAAGELTERVQIQEDQGTSVGLQGAIPDWKTLRRVWAKVETLTGREFFDAQLAQSEVTQRVTIRFPTGIDLNTKHRLYWETEKVNLGIESIANPEQRNEELVILCRQWSEV